MNEISLLELDANLLQMILTKGQTLLLRQTSKALRRAVDAVETDVFVRARKHFSGAADLDAALTCLSNSCAVTGLSLHSALNHFDAEELRGGLEAVVKFLRTNAHRKLKCLVLSANFEVRHHDLSSIRTKLRVVREYLPMLMNNLESIDLGNNSFSAKEARALARALQSNNSLLSISLSNNNLTDAGTKALAAAMRVNSSLRTLNLSACSIDLDGTGSQALAEALRVNRSLTSLNLQSNFLASEDVRGLVAALCHNDSLQSLFLGHNCSHNAVDALADMLRYNTSLRVLELTNNNLNSPGVSVLARALEYNKTLRSLDISDNDFGPSGTDALANALRVNSSLETLRLNSFQLYRRDLSIAQREQNIDTTNRQLLEALRVNTTLTQLIIKEDFGMPMPQELRHIHGLNVCDRDA